MGIWLCCSHHSKCLLHGHMATLHTFSTTALFVQLTLRMPCSRQQSVHAACLCLPTSFVLARTQHAAPGRGGEGKGSRPFGNQDGQHQPRAAVMTVPCANSTLAAHLSHREMCEQCPPFMTKMLPGWQSAWKRPCSSSIRP